MLRTVRLATTLVATVVLAASFGIAPASLLPVAASADGAANDTTPPTMVSVSLSPATVDTAAAAKTISVTAHITDDLSGITSGCCNGGNASLNFRSPSGQSSYASFTGTSRTSGTAQDGIYVATMTVPRYAEHGTWTVTNVSVADSAGNYTQFYDPAVIAAKGLDATFEQSGTGDTTPPTMVSVSLSPATVDTAAAAKTISVTAHITDDLSGITSGCCNGGNASLNFRSPSGQSSYASFTGTSRTSGTAQDGIYVATMTVPRYAEHGTWTVTNVSVADSAGNYTQFYDPAVIAAKGLDATFEQSGTGDTTPPTMVSVSLSPATVDTAAAAKTISVTAHITDDLSGITSGCCNGGNASLNFRSPSGQSSYASFTGTSRTSGTAQDGIYVATMTVPRYAEHGTWTVTNVSVADSAGNYTQFYDPAVIAAKGLDATFDVADLSGHLPGAPTGVTASPGDGQAALAWAAPTDDGGFAIDSYSVGVYSGASLVRTVTAKSPPITVTGLTNGVAYRFRVAATNGAGTGASSPDTLAVTPGPPSIVMTQTGGSEAVGQVDTVTASVSDVAGDPVPDGTMVRFEVLGTNGTDGGGILAGPPVGAFTATPDGQGYWLAARDGTISAYGAASPSIAQPKDDAAWSGTVVDIAPSPSGLGYVVATAEGAVAAFGDATDLGEPGVAGQVALDITPSGAGYRLVDGAGRVTAYGDARPYGNVAAGALRTGEKVVGMAGTPTGAGYWVVTNAGRILPFGDAPALGDTAAVQLNKPVAGMVPTPTGKGYLMVASDGGIFSFGDASFYGSLGSLVPDRPVAGLASTPTGRGYWLYTDSGRVFPFGDAANFGSYYWHRIHDGRAAFAFTSTTPGPTKVAAYPAPGTAGTLNQTWSPGPANTVAVTGPDTAETGTPHTFPATITDAYGNKVADGTPVDFTAAGTGGEAPNSARATTTDGVATFTSTSSVAGPSTVTARVGQLTGSTSLVWSIPPPPPPTAPGPPTAVTATPGHQTATVDWTPPADDGGTPVTGYVVTVRSGATIVRTNTVAGPPTVVTGLTNGTAYTFEVRAVNQVGVSDAAAAPAPVTPRTVPDAPTGVVATPGPQNATASWTAPADNGGAPVTGYVVTVRAGTDVVRTVTVTATSSVVTGLTNGTPYIVDIQALNAAGTSTAASAATPVTPRTVPGAPTGVSAVPGNGSLTVTATAPTDTGGAPVTGYVVTVHAGSTLVKTETATGTTALVTGLTNGTLYTVDVRAINAAGASAAATASSPVTPCTVPGAPTGLTATPGDRAVTMGWTVPTDTGGAAVTGYVVTVRAGGTVVRTDSVPGPPTIVTGLTNGTSYSFDIQAVNSAGPGLPAPSAPVTPRTVPGAPTGVSATPGDRAVTIGWTAPTDTGGAAVTGYVVTVRAGGAVVRTDTVSGPPTVVTGLTNGTGYSFDIQAVNAAGASSAAAASAPVTPRTVPGAPTSASATPGDRAVTIGWTAPTDTGGAAVTGYVVTVRASGAVVRTDTVSGPPTVVTGLTNGTSYIFDIQAVNDAGPGLAAPSAPVTPATVPGAPTGVTAVGLFSTDRAVGVAAVSWSAGPDGGSATTSYRVTASPGGQTAIVAAPTNNTTVSNLQNGVTYTFTVQATNGMGGGPTATSGATTPYSYPAPVPGVSAEIGDGVATVSWGTPPDDGGRPITGYEVTAEPVASADGTRTASASATSVTTRADARGGTLTGLVSGTRYQFKVTALNAAGPSATPAGSTTVGDVVARSGYWMVGSDGAVYAFGDAKHLGNAPVGGVQAADLEPTRSGNGYWVVDNLGRVTAYGDAVARGSAGSLRTGERVTSLSATRSGNGYWLFTNRGRVLTFGDAAAYGDMSAAALNGEVLDSIPTGTGRGYYMVGSDGGIFSFGDAAFFGSMGGAKLNAPVQSLVPTRTGRGYWLVASDGGIFAFGDADFAGSMGATRLNKPITGMVRYGKAYLMVGQDGGIFNFSEKKFSGSLGDHPPTRPIVSVSALGAG